MTALSVIAIAVFAVYSAALVVVGYRLGRRT